MRSRYPAKGLHNLEAALESQREVLRPDGDEVDAWLSQSRSLARARSGDPIGDAVLIPRGVQAGTWQPVPIPLRQP